MSGSIDTSGAARTQEQPRPSRLMVVVLALFAVHVVIWVALGIAALVRGSEYLLYGINLYDVFALMMLAYAALIGLAGYGVYRRSRLLYFLALALLVVNTILSVTDDLGFLDFAVLALDLALLALLIAGRRRLM
jgi:hypothetical protein